MSELSFDDQVEYAWHRYATTFGRLLSAMKFGDVRTLIHSAFDLPGGPRGRITFTLTRARRLRATIDATDLHTSAELREAQISGLVAEGWRLLRNGTLIVEAGQRQAPRIATMGCQAMLTVWDVVHPSFLTRHQMSPHEIFDSPFWPPDEDEDTVLVTGAEQLFQLIKSYASPEQILRLNGLYSLTLPLMAGFESQLEIGATSIGPSVEFRARVVPLANPRALGNVIYHVGRDWPTISLYIEDARLHAVRVVDCAAFHPENLRAGIRDWRDFLTVGAPRIIDLLDSEQTTPVGDEGDIPPLLQEIYDNRAADSPTKGVAAYFDGDVDLILDYQRRCKHQVVEWMERAADAAERQASGDFKHLRAVSTSWAMTDFSLNLALQRTILMRRWRERSRDY